jgi:hypothetical protein
LEILKSFDEAERRDLQEAQSMPPNRRMALIEELRREWYGSDKAESESTFPGILETAKCS